MLFRAPVLLLLLVVACVAAPSLPRVKNSDPEISRRWWTVKEIQNAVHDAPRPWPASANGSHIIPFCFENQATWNELNSLFTRALAKWAVAIHAPALEFARDPACREAPCLCSTPGVAEVTLHTMQAQHRRDGIAQGSEATIGYTDPNVPLNDPSMPRHFLLWPPNTNVFGSQSNGDLQMAHELGERIRLGASKDSGSR